MKQMVNYLRLVLLSVPMLTVMHICYAQQKLVTGIVLTKSDQTPIAGATITVKGSKIGTATSVEGRFSIKAKDGDVLIISGVGIEQQQLIVGSENNLTINVTASAKSLSEVVVTATGIKKEAKRLGYAVQTVDASSMTKAREPDPINSLKGQAAGLSIDVNQEMGHPATVIMRGEDGSNDRPMFVVDGVPLSSDTYNLNPDDIESFTVLKGPNAAALYGSRGRDGAIIINTKKGSKDKRGFSIDVNSSTQMNKGFIAFPKTQDQYGPGEGGHYAYGGGGGVLGSGVGDVFYDVWGPKFEGQLLPQWNSPYTPNQTYTTTFPDGSTYTGNFQPIPWQARGPNHLKDFLQAGLLSGNSIAVSSTSEKTDVRFSIGNTYQRGLVPNTELNNASFSGSITQRFNKHLSLSSYFNYSRQSTPNLPDATYGPNSVIYELGVWTGADWSLADMKDYWLPGQVGIQQKFEENNGYNNPYFMSYEWLRSHYQNNEYGYLSLNYKATDNIDFQLRPSVTTWDMINTEKMPYSAHEYGNALSEGNYREDKRSQFESNVELQGRYHKNSILGFLDVQGMIGGNVRSFSFKSSYVSTSSLNVPGIYSFLNSLGPLFVDGYNSSMEVLSAYSTLDIGYKSYITANLTGRIDKSSAIPANNDSYFYPSISLASVVSEYINLPKAISFFKIRASYADMKNGGTISTWTWGSTGPSISNLNGGYGYVWTTPYDGPNYGQIEQAYTLSPTYNGQTSARYTDHTLSDNIQPAERKALEFGADMRFLQNRLGLDVTRYHYRNSQIVSEATSYASGYSSFNTNGDIYTNDGWEVTLNGTPIKNPKGFTWNITANFFTFIKKWVSLNSDPDNWQHNGTRTDLVYGDAFVRTPDGQIVNDATGLPIDYNEINSANKIFGHSDPDWQWGLINTVSYKNFSLHFQFDGMVGGIVNDYIRTKTMQGGRNIETAEGAMGQARPNDATGNPTYVGVGVQVTNGTALQLDPVNGQITNLKDITFAANKTPTQLQNYLENYLYGIDDLDYIKKTYAKLREVTLTYELPQNVFGKKAVIRKATVSLVGRNLLYFFPQRYKDIDVDQFTTASDAGLQTPTTRSYGINLNFSF